MNNKPLTKPYGDIDLGTGVNEDIYQEEFERRPTIAWHGKVSDQVEWGYWSVDRDSFAGVPNHWQEHELRFGSNPQAPLSPVYITYRLRCAIIGWRRRWEVVTEGRERFTYPWFTPKAERAEGKLSSQLQLLVKMPDDDTLRTVALRGYSKGLSWDNDPGGSFGNSDFPVGVKQTLEQYAMDATAHIRKDQGYGGPPLPWMCAWWVDLTPAMTVEEGKKPKPLYVDVGHSIWVNPFTADMEAHKDLETRFVGPELFQRLQTLRVSTGLDWEKQWDKGGSSAVVEYDDDMPAAMGTENDEIPF